MCVSRSFSQLIGLVSGILILMSSDNVAHRMCDLWQAAMPLQLVLSENRAYDSLTAKEHILKALS